MWVKSLIEKQLNVEAVYCSPSERTRQTADIILNETALKRLPFHYVDDLYDFHGNGLLSVIKSLPDVYNSVMVFVIIMPLHGLSITILLIILTMCQHVVI